VTEWSKDLVLHRMNRARDTMEDARIYNDLFERRQEGDYIDFVMFQESQVQPWIAEAEQLVGHIRNLIERYSVR